MASNHKSIIDIHRHKKKRGVKKKMLSRDCDGCAQIKICSKRYQAVGRGEKVYCPDGTAHLVDEGAVAQNVDLYEQCTEMFQ